MNSNRKLLIQALAVVITSIFLYREWSNFNAKVFYIQILCFIEIAIEFMYLLINKKTLTKDQRDQEIISIILFLIVMISIRLFTLISM